MQPADFHAQRFGLEPIALAGLAGNVGEIFLQFLARPVAFGFAEAALEIGDHALERLLGLVGAHAVVIDELDVVIAGAVQDRVLRFLRQRLPFGVEGEFVMLGERFQRLRVIGRGSSAPRARSRLCAGWCRDRAITRSASICCSMPRPPHFGQAPNGLLNEKSRGSISAMVKPETGQANFSEKIMRSSACVPFSLLPSVFSPPSANSATAMPSARCSAVSKDSASRCAMSARTTMRSTTTSMSCLNFLSSVGRIGDLVIIAVDLQALEAALHPLGDFLAVFAFAALHHGREDIKTRAFGQRQHAVDHLRDGLALDGEAGRGRIGHADARPQQPHVIVDLGDGADGRARIARGGLLLDGNGGREAVDLVDIRLLHHFQELPRIGREQFDIAALAFGIDGVEGERGFARAGQAGEHHQRIARDVEVDVL